MTDVGLLSDGRTAIALHSRRETHLLCLDVFGTPPLVTVEDGELPIAAEPGFIRAAGAALRGASLLSAKARKGDRLLRLTFGTRSRFGVGDEIDLYVELVPRVGNLILVTRDTVVAAAKEFSLAENPARAVSAGATYALPPMLAREVPPALEGPASVLDAMRAHRDRVSGNDARARTTQRRSSLLKRLDARERKVRDELAKVAAKYERALARDELRAEGEAIFARLFDVAEAQRDEAKERATKLFAQYKKFGASIPHLEERQATLRLTLTAIEELRWEAERAGDAEFEDVERAAESLDRRSTRTSPSERTKRRKRSPLEVRTDSGSRILIGRSPAENADLTFHVARPNDLWFHAQGMPGAHVILQRDDRLAAPAEDIEKAASLAAFYSKGQASTKVAIDYTERKFVRAQRDAMAGLVWYTNPRTIVVEPRA